MSLPSRLAYHVIYDDSLECALHYAYKNGWNGIVPDLGVPQFSPEKLPLEKRTDLGKLSQELSIEWGFHAPGDDVSLFTTYPPIRKGILNYFKQIIDLARDLSPTSTNVVIHAGSPPSFRKAGTREDDFRLKYQNEYLEVFKEIINTLLKYAHPDVEIVIENHSWTQIIREVILPLIPKGLKLCLDIPKLFNAEGETNVHDWEVFKKHSEAISVIHIHDWNPHLGSHQVVGEGVINFQPILQFLSKLSISPQYVFEVRDREKAQASLVNFEMLLTDGHFTLK